MAIEDASATINSVQSEDDERSQVKLGPIVTAEVAVNGLETEALIYTGSPVTIASLSFIMKILLQE